MVGNDLGAAVRKRPRDRKAQIVRAAAEAFSARGYYQVSVNDIAAELGISGPALYRHFPNKYALFAATAHAEAQSLLDGTEATPGDLAGTLRALIGLTIDHRFGGGIYRWEGRYLEPADRQRVREMFDDVTTRVAGPLRVLRPGLSPAAARVLATAALSVIASITAHHTALAANRIEVVLADACRAVLESELPPPPDGPPPERPGVVPGDTDRADVLLAAAVRTFGARGYHEASMEEIAAAAGMNASGVYRHFAGKADLLAAALYAADAELTAETKAALAESVDAGAALARLCDRYVALSFAQPDLLTVYFAEFGNLPEFDQSPAAGLAAQARSRLDASAHRNPAGRGGGPVPGARRTRTGARRRPDPAFRYSPGQPRAGGAADEIGAAPCLKPTRTRACVSAARDRGRHGRCRSAGRRRTPACRSERTPRCAEPCPSRRRCRR